MRRGGSISTSRASPRLSQVEKPTTVAPAVCDTVAYDSSSVFQSADLCDRLVLCLWSWGACVAGKGGVCLSVCDRIFQGAGHRSCGGGADGFGCGGGYGWAACGG